MLKKIVPANWIVAVDVQHAGHLGRLVDAVVGELLFGHGRTGPPLRHELRKHPSDLQDVLGREPHPALAGPPMRNSTFPHPVLQPLGRDVQRLDRLGGLVAADGGELFFGHARTRPASSGVRNRAADLYAGLGANGTIRTAQGRGCGRVHPLPARATGRRKRAGQLRRARAPLPAADARSVDVDRGLLE
jgi:hypothetical protein